MSDREEFEKWMGDYAADAVTVEMVIEKLTPREVAWEGYQMRQPEIDALKELVTDATNEMASTTRDLAKVAAERDALKAENERLRKELSLRDIAQECLDADMEDDAAYLAAKQIHHPTAMKETK